MTWWRCAMRSGNVIRDVCLRLRMHAAICMLPYIRASAIHPCTRHAYVYPVPAPLNACSYHIHPCLGYTSAHASFIYTFVPRLYIRARVMHIYASCINYLNTLMFIKINVDLGVCPFGLVVVPPFWKKIKNLSQCFVKHLDVKNFWNLFFDFMEA
jgi:hypothetical protein